MHAASYNNWHKLTPALILGALLSVNAAGACELPTTLSHTITGVVDTRALKLDDGSELRLAGILGPTAYDSPAAPNNWPAEAVALTALSKLAMNQSVAISLERTARDRYGRFVGHALLASGSNNVKSDIRNLWLQALIVRAGQARVALTPEIDEACAKLLLNLEATAGASRKGLWNEAVYQPKRAEDVALLRRYRSTYQIVEGVVASVSVRRSAVYLNFGMNWKRDFTAKLSRAVLKRARIKPSTLKALHKKPLRIRGWLEQRNGPLMIIWRLEQIERLTLTPTGETKRQSPPNLLTDLQSKPPNGGIRQSKSEQKTKAPRYQ
ncbi:MAG: micrococcal nuclease [Alphaproteobacteria bacterium]|jgi:micrococcal nuclease